MREPDPEWEKLAAQPFGQWIKEGVLKYRSAEIRSWISQREEDPPKKPAEVEIGTNRGRFLRSLCLGRPDVSFYGIEIKKGLTGVANRRLERSDADNGVVFHGDARVVLPVYFGENSLDAIYVLFPDPWWKKRHAKRRLVDEDFMKLVAWVLRPGGFFILKSDVFRYARHVQRCVVASERFERKKISDVPGHDVWEPTTRERHCLEDGLPVHAVVARRISESESTGVSD